jgi:hypothetical protein
MSRLVSVQWVAYLGRFSIGAIKVIGSRTSSSPPIVHANEDPLLRPQGFDGSRDEWARFLIEDRPFAIPVWHIAAPAHRAVSIDEHSRDHS